MQKARITIAKTIHISKAPVAECDCQCGVRAGDDLLNWCCISTYSVHGISQDGDIFDDGL
jgi:hypothetical protein